MNRTTIGRMGQLSQSKIVLKTKEPKQQEVKRFEEKEDTLNIISCKIPMYNTNTTINLHIFLCTNNIKYTISDYMTALWPYGRVIRTSTGFHGEFFRKNDDFMSLMYLGEKREEVIELMSRLVEQNIAIDMQ